VTSSHEVLNATLHQHYAPKIIVRPTDLSVSACDTYRQLQSEPHSVFLDSGDMDLNIVIRTFIIANGMAYVQVGGGIVGDSDPV